MIERIVLLTKPTALEELLRRHHSRDQVAFFLKTRGQAIDEYEAAHRAYHAALATVRRAFPEELPVATLARELVSGYLFRPSDLVVVIGPDGLCANVAKYLDGQPVLAVNPDPARIDGALMRIRPDRVAALLPAVLRGKARIDEATLALAETNDGQRLYAVNEFVIGRRDLVSSRYRVVLGDREERQSSSGVLVCTGIGSSGWMKSVVAGAAAITGHPSAERIPYPWDERSLVCAVREPFATRTTGMGIIFGRLGEGESIRFVSEMPDGGVILSDGVVEDAIEWNAGATVTISVAPKTARLVAP